MINEPTYWSADCDLYGCKREWQPYDYDGRESEDDIQRDMRSEGWIVMDTYEVFCSLDHFLTYRSKEKHRREHMSQMAAIHADLRHRSGQYCCHGFHATNHPNGLGHDYDCRGYRDARRAQIAAQGVTR